MDDNTSIDRIAIGPSSARPVHRVALAVVTLLAVTGAAWSLASADDPPHRAAASSHDASPSTEPTPEQARSSRHGAVVTWGQYGLIVVKGRLAHTPGKTAEFPNLQFSPDGTQLYYASTAGHMIALDHAHGTERDLGPCAGDPCIAAVSPDGSHIAYSVDRSLVVRSSAGHELTIDLPGVTLFGPAWSPQGDRLALAADDGLRVVDRGGSNLRTLVATKNRQTEFQMPAWSPDGRSIAYVVRRPARTRDGGTTRFRFSVVTVDAATGAVRTLVTTGSCYYCAGQFAVGVAWSPNGRWVGFVVPGRQGVNKVPAHGGPVRTVRTVSKVLARSILVWQP
jgi:dipeptidyl aminopeptidase/acylaminoacyl peptidase